MTLDISYRAWKVWRRNAEVNFATWYMNLIPPICEPVLYLLAFGLGLGTYLETVPYRGETVEYLAFVAPGLVGVGVLFQSFMECMYGSYIRMHYQKTFEAITATPVTLDEVILGELLWGTTKGVIASILMLVVVSFFGLVHFPGALLVPLIAALGGMLFACLAMCCTALAPNIDSFNIAIQVLVVPMFTLSATFFPTEQLPGWAQWLTRCLPLTHVVELCRAAMLQRLHAGLWIHVAVIVGLTVPLFLLALRLMRRRLIK